MIHFVLTVDACEVGTFPLRTKNSELVCELEAHLAMMTQVFSTNIYVRC